MDSNSNKQDDAFALFLPLMHQIAAAVGLKVDDKFAAFDMRLKEEAKFRAVETQTFNPAMASTPLPRAVAKAEAATYDARARALKAVSEAIGAYLAYSAFKDEAAHKQARLRDYHRQLDQAAAIGLYDETKHFANALREHGVGRWHFRQLGRPQIAIVADLIRWYANDPRLEDATSPWPTIEALYANRSLRKPSDRLGEIEQQSQPGAPPLRIDRRSPDRFYRYGSAAAAFLTPEASPKSVKDTTSVISHAPVAPPAEVLPAEPIVPSAPPSAPDTNEVSQREAAAGTLNFGSSLAPPPDFKNIALQLFDADPIVRSLYWSDRSLEGVFDSETLVPALKTIIAAGRGWEGTKELLAAAEEGNARQFIARKRADMILFWAENLEAGEENIVLRARKAGLL